MYIHKPFYDALLHLDEPDIQINLNEFIHMALQTLVTGKQRMQRSHPKFSVVTPDLGCLPWKFFLLCLTFLRFPLLFALRTLLFTVFCI